MFRLYSVFMLYLLVCVTLLGKRRNEKKKANIVESGAMGKIEIQHYSSNMFVYVIAKLHHIRNLGNCCQSIITLDKSFNKMAVERKV